MLIIKKYPNRRLYDTRHSRYITLDDLAKTIRTGEDVTVQDAQDGRDLTQETLTQLIFDRGGGRILPTTLLLRMIRLDDAALGEFLTRYVSWALEVYLQAKGRARALLPLNPLATAPFAATDALARLVLGASQWGRGGLGSKPQEPPQPPQEPPFDASMVPPDAVMPPLPYVDHDGGSPPDTDLFVPPDVELIEPALHTKNSSEMSDEMLQMRRELELLKQTMGAMAGQTRKTKPKSGGAKKKTKRASGSGAAKKRS